MLVDFGSVRDATASPASWQESVAGTFGYMAPEQISGKATPQSDLYAVGVLAIALLSRREPHELVRGHVLAWKDCVNVRPAVARFLEALVEPDPFKRMPSANEALIRLRELRETLRAEPESAPAVASNPSITDLALEEPEPTRASDGYDLALAIVLGFVLGGILLFGMLVHYSN